MFSEFIILLSAEEFRQSLPLNAAYDNLPVTVVKGMNGREQLDDFNKTWIVP
jgi:hypothetical protein